jgi:hypothetical protein
VEEHGAEGKIEHENNERTRKKRARQDLLAHQHNTDDQGRYRFAKLPAGRYYVAVQTRPWYAQNAAPPPPSPSPVADASSNSAGFHTLRPIVEQNSSLDVVYPITYYPRETQPAKAGTITIQPGTLQLQRMLRCMRCPSPFCIRSSPD